METITAKELQEYMYEDVSSPFVKKTFVDRMKVNDLVMLRNQPCKITSIDFKRQRKHSGPSYLIQGIDIFTGLKAEQYFLEGARIEFPLIESREEGLVLEMEESDGFPSLLLESGEVKEDLKIIPELINIPQSLKDFAASKQIYFTLVKFSGKESFITYRVEE